MKILKYLLLLILIVLIGGSVYIAITDGKFHIEDTKTVQVPQGLVFQQVNNLKNWKDWVATNESTSDIDFSFPGKAMGQGAAMTWSGEDISAGSLTNSEVIHNSSITEKANVEKGFGQIDFDIAWTFEKQADSTLISVKLNGQLSFWAKAWRLFERDTISKQIAPLVKKSLTQLENLALQKMAVHSIHVNGITETEPQEYIFTSLASRNIPEAVAKKREKALKKLRSFADQNHIRPVGAGFMIFNSIDHQHGNIIVSLCIPIAENISFANPESAILLGTLPAQRVIKSTLKGDYKNIGKLWQTTRAYMQRHNLAEMSQAKPYEVFITTAKDSENPADWVTQLFIPIKKSEVSKKDSLLGI